MAVTYHELSPEQIEHLSRRDLEAACCNLQRDVADVRTNRDSLLKEVELLTASATSFDFTSLLRERVWTAETELKRAQKDHAGVKSQLRDVQEDYAELKEAKRFSDLATRNAAQQLQEAQRELSFYQQQAASALQARDEAQENADRHSSDLVRLRLAERDAAQQHEEDVQCIATLNRQLQTTQSEMKACCATAEEVPALRTQLSAAQTALAAEQQRRAELQEEVQQLRCGLEAKALQVQRLEKAQDEHQGQIEQLRQAASHAADKARGAAAERAAEVQRLSRAKDAEIEALTSQCGQARARCAACEEQLAQLHTDHAASIAEVQSLKKAVQELESGMHEVSGEKTQLLMAVADLEQQLRDGGVPAAGDGGDAWTSWPWQTRTSKATSKQAAAGSAQP